MKNNNMRYIFSLNCKKLRRKLPRSGLTAALTVAVSIGVSTDGRAAYPHTVTGSAGAVAADHELASQAGAEVLSQGGNAVDAAIAAALALGVVQPAGSGLGGGGFLLIRKNDGQVAAIDFREVAPKLATRDMFLESGTGKVVPRSFAMGWPRIGSSRRSCRICQGTE
jgi:gamma-glutamyltranspeptidase